MRQRISVIGFFLLIVGSQLAAAPPRADIPHLQGDVYTADLSSPDGVPHAAAVWNFSKDMLTMYVYDRDERVLHALYTVRIETTRTEKEKRISVPSRGLAFSLAFDEHGSLILDGKSTKFARVEATTFNEATVKEAQPCTASAGRVKETASARKLTPTTKSVAWCLWAWQMNGCCDSCFCVHRDLDLPYWVDNLCCGGGC